MIISGVLGVCLFWVWSTCSTLLQSFAADGQDYMDIFKKTSFTEQ